ncbi:MAG: N-acetyltransferase family protein [Bacillota bacterium]
MILVRDARPEDLPRLLSIYNHAVVNTSATFDLEPQTMEQRQAWFAHHGPNYPLLVAEDGRGVLGYACISEYRTKPAYARTVESSVYVDERYHGQGVGTAVMEELLRRAARIGYHCVLAGIVGGNEGSVRLHTRLGFQPVGCLKEVGFKFGRWHDVHFYERILPSEGLWLGP